MQKQIDRDSHQRCFIKKAVHKKFAIIIVKHLCWSLFSIMLQAFRAVTLLKRESNTGVFLWVLGNFQEHLFWRTSTSSCFWIDCNISLVVTVYAAIFCKYEISCYLEKNAFLSFNCSSLYKGGVRLSYFLVFVPALFISWFINLIIKLCDDCFF